jgi:hypothetical protein
MPENKLFRCEVWNEDNGEGAGGLFVDFHWANDLSEVEAMFAGSPDEKLYRAEECSPEVIAAWESGYEEGLMVGIVGERLKGKDSSDEAVMFDIFEELLEEPGETNGQQQ